MDWPDRDYRTIAADTQICYATEPTEGFPGADDSVTAASSAARLFALADQHQATLIYGHDPQQWRDLPKAPNP